MGCCGSTATVPPSSPPPLPAQAGETAQSSHRTSIPSSTTSTVLPKPGAVMPAHERFSDFASSQQPHHSEMRFHPSGGSGSLPRSRYMSEASRAPLPQGALSHSSRTRTASASRVGSRPLAEGHEGRPRFPSNLKSLLPNDFRYAISRFPISHYYHSSVHRFRILVVGKVCVIQSGMPWTQLMHVSTQRESGKSSLIDAVFKVNMNVSVCTQSSLHLPHQLMRLANYKGAPINVLGRTAEFLPRDNRQLIVHECSGSGPRDLQAIRDFVTTRNQKGRPASERLHAIW